MTLAILAAGSARRFGRLKQVEPVGPRDETLIECSIRDAHRAGIRRFILVIRREHEPAIRAAILDRLVGRVEINIAYQELPASPHRSGRPWGTAHALLAARHHIRGPFGVVNADDYYGPQAYTAMSDFLSRPPANPPAIALIAYRLIDTLPQNGAVSRAISISDDQNRLLDLREYQQIQRYADGTVYALEARNLQPLDPHACVSMNMWAFDPRIIGLLADQFDEFLAANAASATAEFQLPTAINCMLQRRQITAQVIPADSSWCGLTNESDLQVVREKLRNEAVDHPSPPQISLDEFRTILAPFHCGEPVAITPLPGGHIHRTFRITCRNASGETDYVLQQFNAAVFTAPESVAANIARVTDHLRERLTAEGATNIPRRVLTPIPAADHGWFVRDSAAQLWRLTHYIPHCSTLSTIQSPSQAQSCAAAFGRFQRMLADLPAPPLHETIPHFHDTPRRLAALESAIATDAAGRVRTAQSEIAAIRARTPLASTLLNLHARGAIPLRTVHNDAKLANVLFDTNTAEPLCVIDLDTVMPGLSLYDFGDMVRSMTATAAEDADPAAITADPSIFEALARGYLSEAAPMLTPAERAHLVTAGKLLTFEQAARFLTDHLSGDVYYAIQRADHNLARCRAQLALLQSLEKQEAELTQMTHLL